MRLERSFLYQRISILVQRFNADLRSTVHDSLSAAVDCLEWRSSIKFLNSLGIIKIIITNKQYRTVSIMETIPALQQSLNMNSVITHHRPRTCRLSSNHQPTGNVLLSRDRTIQSRQTNLKRMTATQHSYHQARCHGCLRCIKEVILIHGCYTVNRVICYKLLVHYFLFPTKCCVVIPYSSITPLHH